MAPQHNGLRRSVFERQPLGTGAQMFQPQRGLAGDQRGPAEMVRLHDRDELIERGGGDLVREPADVAVPVFHGAVMVQHL